MSTLKRINKENIHNYFKDYFEEKGFSIESNKWQFKKNNPKGFDTVIISLSEFETDYILEFHLGKRLNQIENFALAYLNYPTEFSKNSMTMFCSFARLKGKKYERYSLQNFEDLEYIGKELDIFLNTLGLRVLEQWASLLNLNAIFNEDPYSLNMFYNSFTKAIRGTIINRFVGDERYELLEQVYRTILYKNGVPKQRVKDYEKLNSFLRIYSPN